MDKEWEKELPISGIKKIIPVGGGDVNKAYRLETDNKSYFLLVQPNHPANFYGAEIEGLNSFFKAKVEAPRVIGNGQINGDAYLLLNFLEEGSGKQSDLGRLMAKLHHNYSSNGKFGFQYPYEGGDISFDNSWTISWSYLFVNRRLDVLRKEILKKGLWGTSEDNNYRRVRQIILDSLSKHKSRPSLLHGDMWGGNHLFLKDGRPALIDPSAFYGDREFDIGVSLVFGAYNSDFYKAYQEAYPFDKGYQKRLPFYSLYLLMVHLHKFGSMYAAGVSSTMNEIIRNR